MNKIRNQWEVIKINLCALMALEKNQIRFNQFKLQICNLTLHLDEQEYCRLHVWMAWVANERK